MNGKNNGATSFISRRQMIQYLLGELSEPEQEQCEEQFFTDDKVFSELQMVEDQLIDNYVSEALPESQRQRFETVYLNSDRRRQKLKFAQALQQTLAALSLIPQAAATTPSSWQSLLAVWRMPVFRYSVVAALLVGAIFGVWRFLNVRPDVRPDPQPSLAQVSLPSPMIAAPAPNQSATPSISSAATPAAPVNQPKRTTAPITLLSVLSPGQFRDDETNGSTNKITITPNVTTLTLKLKLPSGTTYAAYHATIETVTGRKLITRNLKPTGDFLLLSIPAQALPPEDYLLTLSGKTAQNEYEEVSDYTFRIVKK